jgi:hypothetical protein
MSGPDRHCLLGAVLVVIAVWVGGSQSAQVPRRLVDVSDVGQLYAAVNDVSNEGSHIVLAPGDYVLDASYPNGGRLELQRDMDLQGQPGHPEMVVIDASGRAVTQSPDWSMFRAI